MHIERITSFPKGSLRPCARLVQATLLFRWLSHPFADHRSASCAWSVVVDTNNAIDQRLIGTPNPFAHVLVLKAATIAGWSARLPMKKYMHHACSRPAPWAVACGAVALPSDRRADRQISWFLVMSSQRHLPVSSLPHAWHTAENAGMHACTSWWFLSLHESMHRQRTRAVNM